MPTPTSEPIPRRWNVEVEHIVWLPRMCDKARMSRNGSLGTYLIGHSPVDFALLSRLEIGTDDFIAIATSAPSDAAVLEKLRARGFDEARLRRWSDTFASRYRAYIPLWDLDEGYRRPNAFERALLSVFRAIEAPAMAIVRTVRPRP